jgi:hypothetical protein
VYEVIIGERAAIFGFKLIFEFGMLSLQGGNMTYVHRDLLLQIVDFRHGENDSIPVRKIEHQIALMSSKKMGLMRRTVHSVWQAAFGWSMAAGYER